MKKSGGEADAFSNEPVYVLRAAGTCVAIDMGGRFPCLLHWGADLGPSSPEGDQALRSTAASTVLNNSPDVPRAFTIWPTEYDGWAGTVAQDGNAAGGATTPRPELTGHDLWPDSRGGGEISVRFDDRITAIRGEITYALDPYGVLTVDLAVQRDASLAPSTGSLPYALDGLRALLPVPERATEVLDFSGKWVRERAPQRTPLGYGTHSRRARRGKPGHDSPYLLAVGTPGFDFGHGELWTVHLAWSGDAEYLAERLPEGAGAFTAVLGAGENLRSGEVILSDGDRYQAPTAVFTWSDEGLDGIADRLHRRLRARPGHPTTPRPLVLNTWEAVYFDHDMARLAPLVNRAAEVGVERIILDDGWFHGRRDDSAGLGDWVVDGDVWPNGLAPLADLVRMRGMQFGLWVEPEMINPDSDLARAHPEWILGPREGLGSTARRQHVLDIADPAAAALVMERVSALVSEYRLDYLKWDHNRDLVEPVGRRGSFDRPVVHAQTLALYAMLDELRRRHPGLEIETCSGGGGRVDLGILDRTDRLWASDCNDPVERTQIERWTRLIVPPELIGSHLGATRSHTTSRATDLSFRLVASLTAHAGIELDLSTASPTEFETIRTWTALYRELRPLIHSGRIANADLADPAVTLTGIVAQDGSHALYTWSRLTTSSGGQSGRVRWPGLHADARYRIVVRDDVGEATRHGNDPEWIVTASTGGITLPGAVLTIAGVPMPTLAPQNALLFEVTRLA